MYIAFEGLDGCGKSTQIKMLKEYHFKNVAFIKEPYVFNPAIKKLLFETEYASPVAQTLAFLVCHAEAFAKWPKTEHIIGDRSLYSTLAYTYGYNGDLYTKVHNILRMLNINNFPQIVFYLKMPVSEMALRFKYRNQKKDLLEQRDNPYFIRVNKMFNILEKESVANTKWVTLDARMKPGDIHKKVMQTLAKEIL